MLFKIENLNLIYDIGKEVQTYALRNINLSLDGNRLIGIMGPSGSGKSSLLYSLAGLKIPSSGSISYGNVKFNEISVSKSTELRRKDFWFIFQRHFLIDYMCVLDKYAIIYSANEEQIPQNIIDRVNKDSNVAYVLPYQKVDGSLPKENAQEIILHKRFALQNKLKLGDYVGSEVSLLYGLKGKYKISGIIDGPAMVNVVNENKQNISVDEIMKHAMLIRVKDIKDRGLINFLTSNPPKNIVIIEYYRIYDQMVRTLSVLNTLAVTLTISIILVLCISLGNLNYISFLNRKYEFGVLSAIGYKKTSLYFKLWKENSSVCLLGYVVGIIITTILAII